VITIETFSGFPQETCSFLKNLEKNNSKSWFEEHRRDYEALVLGPAQRFVTAMGNRLTALSPAIHADPRTDKSIFRIHRDIRFSKDKSPYKTHLGLWFWEGSRPRMECSGFYFHLEKDRLMAGTGLYMFPKDLLKLYRDAVVDDTKGPLLSKAMKTVSKRGNYSFGEIAYKKTPRGYDPAHPRSGLLLYNGLYAGIESAVPEELFSADLVEYCFRHFKNMYPLHQWLLGITG